MTAAPEMKPRSPLEALHEVYSRATKARRRIWKCPWCLTCSLVIKHQLTQASIQHALNLQLAIIVR